MEDRKNCALFDTRVVEKGRMARISAARDHAANGGMVSTERNHRRLPSCTHLVHTKGTRREHAHRGGGKRGGAVTTTHTHSNCIHS